MTQEHETKKEAVVAEVLEDPWATHQEIADRVPTQRTYVTQIVNETPGLKEVREAFKHGITVGTDNRLGDLLKRLMVVESMASDPLVQREVAAVIHDQLEAGAVASITLTFDKNGDN